MRLLALTSISHSETFFVQISAGYDITYQCPQPTPMLLALSVHPSRMADVIGPHQIQFDPPIGGNRIS